MSTNFNEQVITRLTENFSRFSEKIAFVIDNRSYSYKDLENKIAAINYLLDTNKEESRIVGIVANDDIETYASILCVWLQGIAYVPIHPNHPHTRNIEILNQVNVTVVLDSNHYFSEVIPAFKVLTTKNCDLTLELKPKVIDDNSLAYILFTSGSTGIPKGVQISRRNLESFVQDYLSIGFGFNSEDKFLQAFDLTFDVSVQGFLIPLLCGGSVYTIPLDKIKYSYAINLLDEHEITVATFPPSMINLLKSYFEEISLPALKYCFLTAEASKFDLVQSWSKCIPNAEIYNLYGPTEGTIYCTFYRLDLLKPLLANGVLAIGKAFQSVEYRIVNDKDEDCNHDEKGELLISGPQVSPGYWNNPEKNSESFITLSRNNIALRYYRTGDICSIGKEKEILYFGRKDYQVKINGYRIELGEIEHQIFKISHRNTLVFAVEGLKKEGLKLIAVIEANEILNAVLLNELRNVLPEYMIPKEIICLEHFPLNANEKVDRNYILNLIQNHV